MIKAFFISDTHFHHEKCWKEFKRPNGLPLRNFTSTEEMNSAIVEGWNSVVGSKDVVYHLGDVTLSRKPEALEILSQCSGRKILIAGNHDIQPMQNYLKYFDKVFGMVAYKNWILSHIPVHPDQLEYRFEANIHGHLHDKAIRDHRYFNVSVERLNYQPIQLEELREIISGM